MATKKVTIAGKKYHLLTEVLDGDEALLAVKRYDKSKRLWLYELRPRTEIE